MNTKNKTLETQFEQITVINTMIPAPLTNYLYIADTLPQKHPAFYKDLLQILDKFPVPHSLIPATRDIWAVDYMPIQIDEHRFIQFRYQPDYLLSSKKYRNTITDVDTICSELYLQPEVSGIVLDGGNVIQCPDRLIMCDKIFSENPSIPRKELTQKLQEIFNIANIVFIPQDPDDFTGHADGMVRHYNEDTVLINKAIGYNKVHEQQLRATLANAGLKYIEVLYAPNLDSYTSAKGLYLNYLHMQQLIILPIFGISEDDQAVQQFAHLFPHHTIKTINCNEIARHGGVLNCISWSILRSPFLHSFDIHDLPWESSNWPNEFEPPTNLEDILTEREMQELNK